MKGELRTLNSLHLSCFKKIKKTWLLHFRWKWKIKKQTSDSCGRPFSSCTFSFPPLGRRAGGEEEWAASVRSEGAQQPHPASEGASRLPLQTHHCGGPVWLGGQRSETGSHVHFEAQAVLLFAHDPCLFFCPRKWWDVARKWRSSPTWILKTGSFRPSAGWLKPSRGLALLSHHQIRRPWIK